MSQLNLAQTVETDVQKNYVLTGYVEKIVDKALLYMSCGFPVHLRGPAGVGKTSLAFYIARRLGRDILFLSGSEEIDASNLLGGYFGLKKTLVEDNFISSVYKKEERLKTIWTDGKLLSACKNGSTVIYDEYTRARPEVNNILLSILEEKLVDIPNATENQSVTVNEKFSMIFTSNPEEYSGVYRSPNALTDRMITIDLDSMDRDTEVRIIMANSDIDRRSAEQIYNMVKYVKGQLPAFSYGSLRSGIMLAKVLNSVKIPVDKQNEKFREICRDVFHSVFVSAGIVYEKKESFNLIVNQAMETIL